MPEGLHTHLMVSRAEAYHYLFEAAVEMEKLGINEYTHSGELMNLEGEPIVETKKEEIKEEPVAAPATSNTAKQNGETPKTPAATKNDAKKR